MCAGFKQGTKERHAKLCTTLGIRRTIGGAVSGARAPMQRSSLLESGSVCLCTTHHKAAAAAPPAVVVAAAAVAAVVVAAAAAVAAVVVAAAGAVAELASAVYVTAAHVTLYTH